MTSPTQRTLAHFRSLGFTIQVVERWCNYSRRRIDLFGVIDLVAVHAELGVVGVQACAGASHAARRLKAIDEPKLLTWLQAGGRFEVVSWAKRGARGKRKAWACRREELVARGGLIVSRFTSENAHRSDADALDAPDTTTDTPGVATRQNPAECDLRPSALKQTTPCKVSAIRRLAPVPSNALAC